MGGAATIGDGVQIAAPSPVFAMHHSGVSRCTAFDLYLSFARYNQLGWLNEELAIGRWVGHLETTEGMISVVCILMRRSVLNETRKWQNCGSSSFPAAGSSKTSRIFKGLAP